MKKRILILCVLFVVFVLALAPAKLLESLLAENKKFSLIGASGSLWSGEFAQASARNLNFYQLEYRVNPLALFLASLSLDVTIPADDRQEFGLQGDFNLSLGTDYQQRILLDKANISVQVSALQSMIPLKGVEIGGIIQSSDLLLELENKKPVRVEGEVSWSDALVSYAGGFWPLGNFGVVFSTDPQTGTISGKLKQSKNELGLQGEAQLTADGYLEFNGSISTEIDKNLYAALRLFSNGEASAGRLLISFKQKIF